MSLTDKKEITVGVIGCGFGVNHIRALAKGAGSFRLKYICDTDGGRLESVRGMEELKSCEGICFTTDYHQLLSDPELDVVSLSLPHHLHRKFAVEAAEAGKQIMLDKPIARTSEEAAEIAGAVKKNGVQLMVAFNYRFDPLYRRMYDVIHSGRIGKVLLAVTRHYQNFYYPGGSNWRNSASIGGGAVMGSGIHNIDMLRYYLGDPDEVFAYAVGDKKRLDAEAAATIVFRYANGTIVNFLCNWCKSSGSEPGAELFGEWEFYGEDGELRIFPGRRTVSEPPEANARTD